MDTTIALMLGQDGLVNGAIYGLMAVALVLVFSVTRVILIPQGEFVAFGTLSMVVLQAGGVPGTLWLVVVLAVAALLVEVWRASRGATVDWRSTIAWTLVVPGAAALLVLVIKPSSQWLQSIATVLLITPLGPLLYRLVYRPLASATVLMLLIASVALHGVLVGLALLFFGAEGSRIPPYSDLQLTIADVPVSGQSLVVIGATVVLVGLMYLFFERSIVGKALRATAMNRVGARLMGIPTELSGDISFALAALIGAVAGLLIAPFTTIYYDTGFLIGLKGFVAAIIGGLGSYPLALLGALLVGQLEAFSTFWASAFKEVIVFTLIIPVLWWRSLKSRHVEDSE